MKLTPTMNHYFMITIFNDLRRELDPFIVDTDMTLIQGEKIQIKFALDKEFDAVITIHENIVLNFQHFVIARDKMVVSKPIYVYYEQLPSLVQRQILPVDDILTVMPGDPIVQVVNLITAINEERAKILDLLKDAYISRRKSLKINTLQI